MGKDGEMWCSHRIPGVISWMKFRAQERRRFCLCVLVSGERDICWGCGGLGVGFGVWWEEGMVGGREKLKDGCGCRWIWRGR